MHKDTKEMNTAQTSDKELTEMIALIGKHISHKFKVRSM